jgi:hypothetical protein
MASEDIAKQLKATLEECARLREENKRLRSIPGITGKKPNASGAEGLSPEDKVALFRDLFRGREDVYPARWEARMGKTEARRVLDVLFNSCAFLKVRQQVVGVLEKKWVRVIGKILLQKSKNFSFLGFLLVLYKSMVTLSFCKDFIVCRYQPVYFMVLFASANPPAAEKSL